MEHVRRSFYTGKTFSSLSLIMTMHFSCSLAVSLTDVKLLTTVFVSNNNHTSRSFSSDINTR